MYSLGELHQTGLTSRD